MEHDLAFAKTGRARASRRTGRTAALRKAMAGGAVQIICGPERIHSIGSCLRSGIHAKNQWRQSDSTRWNPL